MPESFLDLGHAVHLHIFDADLQVPGGVTVLDAGALIPRDRFFVNRDGFGKGWPECFRQSVPLQAARRLAAGGLTPTSSA